MNYVFSNEFILVDIEPHKLFTHYSLYSKIAATDNNSLLLKEFDNETQELNPGVSDSDDKKGNLMLFWLENIGNTIKKNPIFQSGEGKFVELLTKADIHLLTSLLEGKVLFNET